jgi:hypothetical protein
VPPLVGTEPPSKEAYARFVDTLVSIGREQVSGQLDGSKQFDAKSLGLLTALGAFASFILANRGAVGGLWGIALVPTGFGVVGCLLSLFGRDYDKGPNVRAAYERYAVGGAEPSAFLIAELSASVSHNVRVAKWKSLAFGASASLLVGALIVVGISVLTSNIKP